MDMRPSRKKIFGGWSKAYLNYNFYIDETLEQNLKKGQERNIFSIVFIIHV